MSHIQVLLQGPFGLLLWTPLAVRRVVLCPGVQRCFPAAGSGCSNCPFSLRSAEVGTIFALSWLITWFGHVLSDFRHVVRLYDFFLACHPLMPIYFAAVVSTVQ